MNQQLAKFEPSGPPEESGKEVELPQENVTEEQAIEALQRIGHIKLPKGSLGDLAKLGIYQSNVGVFKIQRGQALLNQQRMNAVMDKLTNRILEMPDEKKPEDPTAKPKKKKIKTPDSLQTLAHTLGYLSSKFTESQHLMLEMETSRPGGPHDEEPSTQKSFGAGEDIKPGATRITAQTVHIHEAPKAPAEPAPAAG